MSELPSKLENPQVVYSENADFIREAEGVLQEIQVDIDSTEREIAVAEKELGTLGRGDGGKDDISFNRYVEELQQYLKSCREILGHLNTLKQSFTTLLASFKNVEVKTHSVLSEFPMNKPQ